MSRVCDRLSGRLVCRYDVEIFQNIEGHIKLKMEEFPHDQDAVMMLNEHVAEASRIAERKVNNMVAHPAQSRTWARVLRRGLGCLVVLLSGCSAAFLQLWLLSFLGLSPGGMER
jgi:hypothetical protein